MKLDQKIEKLYEVIADKTLSFGCRIIIKDNEYDLQDWVIIRQFRNHIGVFETDIWAIWEPDKIIWHPVMYGSMLRWVHDETKKRWDIQWAEKAMWFNLHWRLYEKPIEEQSDDCIDFIYSLIEGWNLRSEIEWVWTTQKNQKQ